MIFPPLPAPAKPAKPVKSKWPEDARKLAASLLRVEQLKMLKGGLEYSRTSESFDHRYGNLTGRGQSLDLYSPKSWLNRSSGDASQTTINWCDGKERGMIQRAFQLGRIRPAEAGDLDHKFIADDFSLSSLEESYATYSATVQDAGEANSLDFKSPTTEIRYVIDPVRKITEAIATSEVRLIDTVRHVTLSIEYGIAASSQCRQVRRFRGMLAAAAVQGPAFHGQGQLTSRDHHHRGTGGGRVSQAAEGGAGRTRSGAVLRTLPKVADAKRAIAAGTRRR